ncbi:MAG: GNAT family N-acetyltransferase [Phycisphaerae bacterium]
MIAIAHDLYLPAGSARLTPLRPEHARDVFAVFRDEPEILRYFTDAQPQTLQQTDAMIADAVRKAADDVSVALAIVEQASGKCIGSTTVFDIHQKNRSCEIGFTWVAAPFRRTSVNTECKFLLFRQLFEQCGLLRVQLKCDARNERSQAAILRIGAKFEGRLRKHRVLHDGFIRDTMMYSVIDDEWPMVKAKLLEMLGPAAAAS